MESPNSDNTIPLDGRDESCYEVMNFFLAEIDKWNKIKFCTGLNERWRVSYACDEDDCRDEPRCIFFANSRSITLARCFGSAFVVESYRTTGSGDTVLHIIASTPFGSTFSVGLALISSEDARECVWAMEQLKALLKRPSNPFYGESFEPADSGKKVFTLAEYEPELILAIQKVFPRSGIVVCSKYVMNDILVACKRYFTLETDWVEFIKMWTCAWQSIHKDKWDENFELLELTYAASHPQVIRYLIDKWVPLRGVFVRAWTNSSCHFGVGIDTPVEAESHKDPGFLRKIFNYKPGEYKTVFESISIAIQSQLHEVTVSLMNDKASDNLVLDEQMSELIGDCRDSISNHAMVLCIREASKVRSATAVAGYKVSVPKTLCSNTFTRTMGIPCSHLLYERLLYRQPLVDHEDFHAQWLVPEPRLFERWSNDYDKKDISSCVVREDFHCTPPRTPFATFGCITPAAIRHTQRSPPHTHTSSAISDVVSDVVSNSSPSTPSIQRNLWPKTESTNSRTGTQREQTVHSLRRSQRLKGSKA